MSGQRHRIRRQVVELTVSNPEVGREIQNGMQRIMSGPVAEVVEACCDAASRPERLDRVDTITVDLGRLQSGRLELEMVTRLEERLPIALATAVASGTTSPRLAQRDGVPPDDDRVPSTDSIDGAVELVVSFARTGALPWWADVVRPNAVGEAIALLTRRAPEPLASAFGQIAADRAALLRIVRHLDEVSLTDLVGALLAGNGAHLGDAIRELAALLARSPALRSLDPRHRSTAVWQGLVLGAVEVHRHGGAADPWEEMLVRVAIEAGVLRAALTAGTPGRRIADLTARHRAVPDRWARPNDAPDGVTPTFPLPLEPPAGKQDLHHGEPDGSGAAAVRGPNRRRGETDSRAPATGRVDGGRPVHPVREVDDERPESNRDGIVVTARPDRRARRPSGRAEHGSDEPASDERGEAPTRRANDDLHRPSRQSAAPARSPRSPAQTEAIEVAVAASDEADVGNAGVVILTPFVVRFLTRLGLVADGSFDGHRAAHRAAGMLHTMVTGDARPPEYQLALPKVLCGVDPNDVIDLGDPPTDEELAECERLLQAALAQAPALGQLSVAGLRSTFLMRRGVLRSRPGCWQLGVERETFDVLLERLPWSFGWVKLPWMEAPLEVNW